ncbi:Variable surface lipoprotein L (VpmaL) [Mycoplasmopsis agalactiae 14628]|uniref:Variable surface lipoprotein L (VpmaL) n=1 Tax=Mycoplasmopsis agalactiae 14628 TaxID=1110504 RepID=I5D627_MYCAA|nr:variable surface lipoprotein [Mycoplasmopsis agalactiae]EIN15136.1 Variable surface lipoprotein L (VpmaL) [Mycoplasmopsis agalactiae 14628]
MKKSKFLLLGSLSSLVAIPFVAAKCGDTKDEEKKQDDTMKRDGDKDKSDKKPGDDTKKDGNKDKSGKDESDKKDGDKDKSEKDRDGNNDQSNNSSNLKSELKGLWNEVTELARARSNNEYEALFYSKKDSLNKEVEKVLSTKNITKESFDAVIKKINEFKKEIKKVDSGKTFYELSKLEEQRNYFASLMPILKNNIEIVEETFKNLKTTEEPEHLSELDFLFDNIKAELTNIIDQYDLAIKHFHEFKESEKESKTSYFDNLFTRFDILKNYYSRFINKDGIVDFSDIYDFENADIDYK